jgi:hypothetical protein
MPYSSPELFEFIQKITSFYKITNLIRVRIKDNQVLQIKYFQPDFKYSDELKSDLEKYKPEIQKITAQMIDSIVLQNADCCHEKCVGCVNYSG